MGDGLPNDTKSRQYSYASPVWPKTRHLLLLLLLLLLLSARELILRTIPFVFTTKSLPTKMLKAIYLGHQRVTNSSGELKVENVIIVNKYVLRMWNFFVWFRIKSTPGCCEPIEL